MLKHEVSEANIIAQGYTDEAIEILKTKKKGNYNIVAIDPSYEAAEIEQKDVFAASRSQRHSDYKISANQARQHRDENKDIPKPPNTDLVLALITLKYTPSVRIRSAFTKEQPDRGRGRRPAEPHPLHAPCRQQGRHTGACATIPRSWACSSSTASAAPNRDNAIDVTSATASRATCATATTRLQSQADGVLTTERRKNGSASRRACRWVQKLPFGDNIRRAPASRRDLRQPNRAGRFATTT